MRILHLISSDADFQTRRTLDALRTHLGDAFTLDTRRLGEGGDFRNMPSAVLQLRRNQADMVHAWGISALTTAAMCGARRIIFSPTRFAGPRAIRWIRSVMGYRDVHMICASATQHRAAIERGVPLDRCHVIRPGVEFSRIHRRRNDSFRASLGFNAEDFVLLAPGESTRQAAHEEAVWACGILNVLDPRYKILLWGQGGQAQTAATLAHRLRQQGMVRIAEPTLGRSLEFEELLPAVDACLVTARGPVATLPIAICMAAALPIVSTVTYTIAELLEDRHTALMVTQPSPRLIAQRVLDLRADSSLQWSVADMARTEAYEYFALTRMINQYQAAYQQVLDGAQLEIPQATTGAGLRFHGRA